MLDKSTVWTEFYMVDDVFYLSGYENREETTLVSPPVLGFFERRNEGLKARSLLAIPSPTSSETSELSLDEEPETEDLALAEELTDVDIEAGPDEL